MTFSTLPKWRFSLRSFWLVYLIVALCILIELVLVAGDMGWLPFARLRRTAYEYAGFWPGLLGAWSPNYPTQPYTMFGTYAFLHGGLSHLIVNMITLVSLGRAVVDRVGIWGFAGLYSAAVLGGALGFGLLASTTQPMVGASGGLFGLIGGILAWNYVDRFTAQRRLWPVLRAVGFLVLLNLVLWWVMDGLLAWQTHLGGGVAGWVAALLIDPRGMQEADVAPNSDQDDA